MQVTITNQYNTAVIDSRGAELQSFQTADGTEYIWQGDPAYWSGRSPVLFPIIGNLRNDLAMIDGKPYHIPKHGIARHAEFTLTEQHSDRATFTLTADEHTLSQYPFLFCLRLHYRVTGSGLRIDYRSKTGGINRCHFVLAPIPLFVAPFMRENSLLIIRCCSTEGNNWKAWFMKTRSKRLTSRQGDTL